MWPMVLQHDCTTLPLKSSQGACFRFVWLIFSSEKTIKYVSIVPKNNKDRDTFLFNSNY